MVPEANEPTITTANPADRRRNCRFVLGLPVRVHLAGIPDALTVELMDLSLGGGRFRATTQTARLNQNAAIVFVLPGQRRCLAKGRVVRTDPSGEFALRLDRANAAFVGFVGELAH